MNWYIEVLKKYATFDGRSRRTEYWMFTLCNIVISSIISAISNLFNMELPVALYSLFVLIPTIAVSVRRFHDIGKSAVYLLLIFIPILGQFIFLYFMCKDSEPGPNQYGLNPKEDPFTP